eukprot:GHRQ01024307.1.p1 GENE.GHRQ01024307.1~~GHRQ01024307.1.p1  ORF type:complete len:115 (+),score=5.82 GHRQ01024307.1:113-457(+)
MHCMPRYLLQEISSLITSNSIQSAGAAAWLLVARKLHGVPNMFLDMLLRTHLSTIKCTSVHSTAGQPLDANSPSTSMPPAKHVRCSKRSLVGAITPLSWFTVASLTKLISAVPS